MGDGFHFPLSIWFSRLIGIQYLRLCPNIIDSAVGGDEAKCVYLNRIRIDRSQKCVCATVFMGKICKYRVIWMLY